jgi:tetratricopeptide (TPR) repeat protein
MSDSWPLRVLPENPADLPARLAGFDCGKTTLNAFLHTTAVFNQQAGASRTTYLHPPDDSDTVVGYYSLALAVVDQQELPARVRRRLIQQPLQAVPLLARLAVDRRFLGRGFGERLLIAAMRSAAIFLVWAQLLAAGWPEEAAEKRFDSPEAAYEAKDYGAAIRLFDEEIAANLGDAAKLCGRGLALLQIAEYDKALADFEAALKLEPDDALAHYGRGRVRRARRQPSEAMRDLTRAIELAPSSDAAFLAHCERARLFCDYRDQQLAVMDAEKALAMRPSRPEGHVAQGDTWFLGTTEDERNSAANAFSRALTIDCSGRIARVWSL